jgi:hypothetical protein
VRLWEVATGKELTHRAFGSVEVNAVTFSPTGRRLAAALSDGTVPCWDFAPCLGPGHSAPPQDEAAWQRTWEVLASPDPALAFSAMPLLLSCPRDESLRLPKRLAQKAQKDSQRLRRLLAELDDDNFQRREAATAELARGLAQAEGALRAALESSPSAEVRRRIQGLLETATEPSKPDGETLRALRLVWLMQRLDTPEARQLLESIAAGVPGMPPTHEARWALECLDRRAKLVAP